MTTQYWRNGEPTDAGVNTFTDGDCWILAYTLWRETGWPIYLVDPTGSRNAVHYVVKAPGDRYLDVLGVWTRGRLLRHWTASSLVKAPQGIYDMCWNHSLDDYSMFDHSWRRAPVMARRLLEKYGERA